MTVSIGVDVGREHDLTVIAVIEETEGGEVWLRAVRSFKAIPFEEQENAIREYAKRYKPRFIVIDATGIGAELAERMRRELGGRVEELKITNQVKSEVVARAWDLFMEHKLKVPLKYRAVVDEVSYIRREETATGVTFKDDPHGDAGWALLYAIRGLPRGGVGVTDFGEATAPTKRGEKTCGTCGLPIEGPALWSHMTGRHYHQGDCWTVKGDVKAQSRAVDAGKVFGR